MGSTSRKMNGFILRAAIAACIIATAYADGCGADEVTKIGTCTGKLVAPTGTDKKEWCTYVKETMECYPKDCCKDATQKAAVDKFIADYKSQAEDGCDIECGPHDEHDHGGSSSPPASSAHRVPAASLAPVAAVAVVLSAFARVA